MLIKRTKNTYSESIKYEGTVISDNQLLTVLTIENICSFTHCPTTST